MREKLIELIKQAKKHARNTNCDIARNMIFADHLLANGVILPPCKVGDVVYKVVNDKRMKKPYECEVVGFWYSEDENCNNVHLERYVNGAFDFSFSVPFTDFGKTVFLSREDAEKALKDATDTNVGGKEEGD